MSALGSVPASPAPTTREANEQSVFLRPGAAWTDASYVSAPVSGFPAGPALVTVFVNGIPSASRIVLAGAVAPTITSANTATVAVNTPFSFQVTATGVPLPSLSTSSPLPGNLTLADNGNGTATLSGTAPTASGSYPITITAANGVSPNATQSFTLVVSPGAAASLVLSAPADATAGTAFSFTATVRDQFNNVATNYTGTVSFTSSDGAANLPTSYAFAAADNGARTFSATLRSAGAQTITATDAASSLSGTSGAINVSAAAATRFAVFAPASVTTGSAFSFGVTARDAFGNPATGYAGTVHFTSSDGAATLPANVMLASGGGTFSTTLRTAGSQTITATDTVSASIAGTSGSINVSGTAPSITSANTVTFTIGSGGSFTVTTSGSPAPALTRTGTLSGNPAAGSNASYPVTITASNGINPNATQPFTLVINRRPVAGNDTLGARQFTPVRAPKAKLLANDSDPDGEPLSISAVSPTSAQGGTVTMDATSVTYTPANSFTGSDAFSYTVSDGRGGMATGTVSVTVTPADAATLNIVSIAMEAGGVRVVAQGIPGQRYQFQSSPGLSPAEWADAGAPQTANSTGRFEVLDPTSPAPMQRFYRAISAPPQ